MNKPYEVYIKNGIDTLIYNANRVNYMWEFHRLRIDYTWDGNTWLNPGYIKNELGFFEEATVDNFENYEALKAYSKHGWEVSMRIARLRLQMVIRGHNLVWRYVRDHPEVREDYFNRNKGFLYFDILTMAE